VSFLTIEETIGRNIIEESIQKIIEMDKIINSVLRIEKVVGNKNGKYFGIPFLVKDNILVKGTKTTNASKILENYISPYTATAVQKLLEAGFSLIGKTNMDEFAMGNTNENSYFGPVRNPKDLSRVSGGSSGGSAAAVGAGYVPFSLGTDTGGSVRLPASFCGVVGFKPSYGMISRYGVTSFASSLDQIGILSNSVKDVSLVVEIIKGKDKNDPTTLSHTVDLTSNLERDLSDIKICIPKIVYDTDLNISIKNSFNEAVDFLKAKGSKVEVIDIPELEYSVAVYYIIAPSEASSNLARFDGVRYGFRNASLGLNDMYRTTREIGFGIEVKRRIIMGTFNLSADYYSKYYSKALKVRRIISDKLYNILDEYDVMMTPTSPSIPPYMGEKFNPLEYYLMDTFTIPANLAGLPAINIPFGLIEGLPFGIQFIGRQMKDEELLAIANTFHESAKKEFEKNV